MLREPTRQEIEKEAKRVAEFAVDELISTFYPEDLMGDEWEVESWIREFIDKDDRNSEISRGIPRTHPEVKELAAEIGAETLVEKLAST